MKGTSIIEQNLGVNPFEKRIEVDRKPEAVQNVETTLDEAVERTMQKYNCIEKSTIPFESHNQIKSQELEMLTSVQIQLVLGQLPISNSHTMNLLELYSINDMFISKLIQSSYDAGNNDFILNTRDLGISLISLKGTKNNPIHTTILGNVTGYFGHNAENCIFDIYGSTQDNCGHESTNCRYNITGDIGERCGRYSHDCTYNITGNAGCLCGEKSKMSTYNINGDTREFLGYESQNCVYNIKGKLIDVLGCIEKSTFNVQDEESYQMIVRKFPNHKEIVKITDSQGTIMETKK